MAILECTKRVEYGMRTIFQITASQNQEDNPDPHEPKVLFLGTPVKKESAGQATISNLSYLEETPESPNTYVSDLSATFLGFVRDSNCRYPCLHPG